MSPKRPSPLDKSPADSSSEGEETASGEEEDVSKEETSSEEEEETSSEEEEEKVDFKLKKPAPLPSSASATDKKVASKKQDPPMMLQAQESSSEFESGSGSESESDAEAEKNVKPIASKPMEETPKRQKLLENADMTGIPARKRPQRLWSEEDEIVILKGISDYTEKKGFEPPANMKDFHNFINKYLHIDVSRSQLQDKVWRLKKKYKNNVRRGMEGADPIFTKPHEQKSFEMAKKVWGNKIETLFPDQPTGTLRKRQRASMRKSSKKELFGMLENVKENDKMHGEGNLAPSECLNELLDFNKKWRVVGPPNNVVKRGLELIEGSKKTELEEQWKQLHCAELKLFVRRTELVRDQAWLITEAYKSSLGR